MTRRTTETTSTSVSTTRPDLSPLPARRTLLWQDIKRGVVKAMLWSAIISPVILSVEYVYLRIVVPAQNAVSVAPVSTKIPPPFVNPGIIVVQPPETEPLVTTTPPAPSGKHRAPEATTAPPTGTRRVAPASPSTTPPPAPPSTTSVPPSTPSSTPIYDTLRNETVATNSSLATVIPE